MAGMTDIIVIGLVGIMGYYVLSSGALNNILQPAASTPTPTYTEPAPATPAPAAAPPTLLSQCETEGGKWQGNCCSCPNGNCTNKCGAQDKKYTNEDVCNTEDGVWQYNRYPQCCSCPNKNCSWKCGGSAVKKTPSGGIKGTLSESTRLSGLCQSEGGKWNGSSKCCSCPNQTCKNKCQGSAPAPAKKKTANKGLGSKHPLTPKQKNLPNKLNQCAGLTGATYLKCVNSGYAHAYLAGSSNRRGPSYTGRDDFRHLTNVEFPTPVDFQYESVAHPYFLGPVSPERHQLIKRFQSNFSTMKFSG